VSNEGFDHSFSRALSQLGSAPKRRGSCHAPGVSPGTVARCTAMEEADHAKASAKFFFLHPRQRHPSGLRRASTSSKELRQADKKTKERLSKKDGGKGCPRSRNFESLWNYTVSTQGSATLQGSGAHPRLQRSFRQAGTAPTPSTRNLTTGPSSSTVSRLMLLKT
jgi:hypothetical protein